MSSVFSRRRVMRAVGCGVVALGGASATVAGQEESRESAANKAHCEWLAAMIRQTEAIRVGMTRSEVEKTFDLDFPPATGLPGDINSGIARTSSWTSHLRRTMNTLARGRGTRSRSGACRCWTSYRTACVSRAISG